LPVRFSQASARLPVVLRVTLCLLACLVGCGSSSTLTRPSATSPVLGKSLRFDLPSEAGDRIFIPVRHMRATVVTFWSPGCKPCRNWVSELVRLRPDIEAKESRLVLVAALAEGQSLVDARSTLSDWNVASSFVVDQGGAAQSQAAVSKQPATFVVDEQGVVKWVAPEDAAASDVIAAIP
jgi:thiol-disulfide isomerase/thioredoxin